MWSGSCRFLKRSSVCLLSLTRLSSGERAGHNCVAEPVHKMRWYGRGDDKGKRGWQNRADGKTRGKCERGNTYFPSRCICPLFSPFTFLVSLTTTPPSFIRRYLSFVRCSSLSSASPRFIKTRKVGYRLYGVERLFNEMFDNFASDEMMVQYVPSNRNRFDAWVSSLRSHIVFSRINVSIGGFAGNWISSRQYRKLYS